MVSPLNSSRAINRSERIAAMKAPFADWLKWSFASVEDSKIGSWMNDSHPILGEGVFRFDGRDGLSIYERGIAHADGSPAILFADISGYDGLTLREFSRAQNDIWGNVELRIRTEAGGVVLTLPLVHYANLIGLLSEHARRLSK